MTHDHDHLHDCDGDGNLTMSFPPALNFSAPLGAEMLLLGPGDMRCAHAAGERLALDDLAEGIVAFARVAQRLA